jgi:ATP adenylyltransferase
MVPRLRRLHGLIAMDYLFNTNKIKYVRGSKPDVGCILCAVRDRLPEVKSLEIHRTGTCGVSLNLYPFNPGHLMIFPLRHVEKLQDITDDEAAEIHRLTSDSVRILTEEMGPSGFNIGYNLGRGSGASIQHVHQHIVPRYENEIGYLDVLAGARVIVSDPVEILERLKCRFMA